MSKAKYRYNIHTLSYDRIEKGFRGYLLSGIGYLTLGLFFGGLFYYFSYTYFDSPKEKLLIREKNELLIHFDILNKRIDDLEEVLSDIQQRDDNVYRVIFETEPIPKELRKSSFFKAQNYKVLEKLSDKDLVLSAYKKADKLTKQIYIQTKSLDEIAKKAKNKKELLAAIPAIQPIENRDLKRTTSGYGYRMDPIYKTTVFHAGIDFAAKEGTPIYATGKGIIHKAENSTNGYGQHVIIDHGFGYQTLYGHMSKIKVKAGEKVVRGSIIGYVGSTGKSTAPHVHYEVIKNNQKINPINFFFNDLTAEQYTILTEQTSIQNQAFD